MQAAPLKVTTRLTTGTVKGARLGGTGILMDEGGFAKCAPLPSPPATAAAANASCSDKYMEIICFGPGKGHICAILIHPSGAASS